MELQFLLVASVCFASFSFASFTSYIAISTTNTLPMLWRTDVESGYMVVLKTLASRRLGENHHDRVKRQLERKEGE